MTRETNELIFKLLNLYAFANANSTVNISDIRSLKISMTTIEPALVSLHYRLVESSSVDDSRRHSVKLFKKYQDYLSNGKSEKPPFQM